MPAVRHTMFPLFALVISLALAVPMAVAADRKSVV